MNRTPIKTQLSRGDRLVIALLIGLMVSTACGTEATTGGGGGGDAPGPSIKVIIESPQKDAWVSGIVTITGTVDGVSDAKTVLRIKGKTSCELAEAHPGQLIKDKAWLTAERLVMLANAYDVPFSDLTKKEEQAKVVAAVTAAHDAVKGACESTGATFSLKLDTRAIDDKGKEITKDGKLTVLVSASSGSTAAGASLQLQLDNTEPQLEILEPKPGQVFIGRTKIIMRLTEKNPRIENFTAQVVELSPIKGKPTQPVSLIEICNDQAKAGEPKSCADCKKKHGLKAGGPYNEMVPVCVGKPGTYVTYYERLGLGTGTIEIQMGALDMTDSKAQDLVTKQLQVKMLKPPRFDVAESRDDPDVTSLVDYMLFDYDRDSCLDLVLCNGDGVFVRRAKYAFPLTDPPKCSGEWLAADKLSSIACDALARGDLDLHGKSDEPTKDQSIADIIAIGAFGEVGTAEIFLTRPGDRPKSVQKVSFPSKPTAIAVGKVDDAGGMDIVVGAELDEHALTVALSVADPICPTKDEPLRRCKDVDKTADLTLNATVLGPPKTRALAGNIKVLVLADFVSSDEALEIAIGRSTPVLSVCRNKGGGVFDDCVNTGETGPTAGMGTTDLLVAYNWTYAGIGEADSVLDIIVGSKKSGSVRWLRGVNNGTFEFDGFHQGSYGGLETIALAAIGEDVDVAPRCGDGKTLAQKQAAGDQTEKRCMLVIGGNARTPLFDDADGKFETMRKTCFRSTILGGRVTKILPGDVDGDGLVDLTGMDTSPPVGITVARGTGPLTFHGADVLRICRTDLVKHFFTWAEVGQFAIGDVDSKDGKDLLLGSHGTDSSLDYCLKEDSARPGIMFHLYLNELGAGLGRSLRYAEFAPFSDKQRQESGAKDGGCGAALGKLSGMLLADLDNEGGPDLVFAMNKDYTHGKAPEEAAFFAGFQPNKTYSPTAPNPDPDAAERDVVENKICTCLEHYEVNNLFGEDTDQDAGQFCSNLITDPDDTKKKQMLRGYGQNGAPIGRASLIYAINDDNNETMFGMQLPNVDIAGGKGGNFSKALVPRLAQSGGREIAALTKVRFPVPNPDSKGPKTFTYDHILTVMDEKGAKGELCYLAPRVRLFRTEKNVRIKPVMYARKGSYIDKYLGDHFKGANEIDTIHVPLEALPSYNPTQPDDPTKLIGQRYVTYRTIARGPTDATTAMFCGDSEVQTLFTLNPPESSFCYLRAKNWGSSTDVKWGMEPTTCVPLLGDGLQAFAAVDAVKSPDGTDPSGCTDVLFAKDSGLGYSLGQPTGFQNYTKFFDKSGTRSAINMLDLNQDDTLDMVVVDSATNNVEVHLSDGLGNFVEYTRPIRALNGSGRMELADFDNDGCNDLVVQGEIGVAVYRSLGCE